MISLVTSNNFFFGEFILLIFIYRYNWKDGKVPLSYLQKIFSEKGYESSVQQKIIHILEKFEIIYCSYNVSNEEKSLSHLVVPSLLSQKAPNSEFS